MVLLLDAAALPKAVEWLPVPSQQYMAWYIWKNAVAFLQEALRLLTLTLFSFQGTPVVFYQRREKVEMPSKGLNRRETRLTAGVGNPEAYGGFSVRSITTRAVLVGSNVKVAILPPQSSQRT